ncbi:MAG TPA: SGNH/GDSL hydrolase family protein [Ornithinibacter sp.]|nr:SGNH/GDSL hydrolase family protein [Ornithinibacter sp.]
MHRRRWAVVVAVLALGGLSAPVASAQAPAAPGSSSNAMGWYLAMGDSLAAGYQPGQGDDKTGGYVGGVLDAVKADTAKTKLVNVACSGETVVTMVAGGRCAYDEGTQLAQSVEFLHAHSRTTRLVTIDIGANDVQRCVSRSPLGIDLVCIQQGLGDVQRLLPQVLAQLHAAAPGARIVVLNYYNPFLAAYLTGAAGQALAQQSVALQAALNTIIAGSAASVGADVADVSTAFRSTVTTPVNVPALGGPVPTNVATICAWTWMCQLGDIHANDTGYAVMTGAVAARL